MQTILIVDDNADLASTLVALLEGPDRHLRTAATGKQAVAVLQAEPVALVITDMNMPEMNGYELVAYLNRHHPQTPVIVLTAHCTTEMQSNLPLMGVGHCVRKDAALADLEARVAQELARVAAAVHAPGPREPGLVDALWAAAADTVDGEVVVRNGAESGRVFFVRGQVAWAVASTVRQTLAHVLVERAGVREEDLRSVFAECRRTRANFGETVVEWGLVERDTLREHLRQHVAEVLAVLCAWPHGPALVVPERRHYESSLLFNLEEVLQPAVPQDAVAPPAVQDGALRSRRNLAVSAVLEALRGVEGFLGAAAYTHGGDLVGQVAVSGAAPAAWSALVRALSGDCCAPAALPVLGRIQGVHVSATGAEVFLRCVPARADAGPAHAVLVLHPEGNTGLGRLNLDRAVAQVAALLSP